MWYVYEVLDKQEDLRARYPARNEAEAHAQQLRGQHPKALFIVRPSEEEAARIREAQGQLKRRHPGGRQRPPPDPR